MKDIKCNRCGTLMTKGQFAPAKGSLGILGLGVRWTTKLNFSKWKIQMLPTIDTCQYNCPDCGIIETYTETGG